MARRCRGRRREWRNAIGLYGSRVPVLLIRHRCPCGQEKCSPSMGRPGVDGVEDRADDREILVQKLIWGRGSCIKGGLVYTHVDVVALDPELRAEAHALRTALGAGQPGDSQPGRCTSILMIPARSCVSIKPLVRARTLDGRVLVVIVPGRPRHEEIWQLMAAGASDVICDGDHHDVKRLVTEITLRLHRWRAIDDLVDSERIGQYLVGNSAPLRMLQRQVVQAAIFTLAPVLLVGESGTGKELVARLLARARPTSRQGRSGAARLHYGGAVTVRKRVLRPRERRLHRGHDSPRRRVRARRSRDAVSRRGRRAAPSAPGRAAASGTGRYLQARRR